jgi:hypothetical protein
MSAHLPLTRSDAVPAQGERWEATQGDGGEVVGGSPEEEAQAQALRSLTSHLLEKWEVPPSLHGALSFADGPPISEAARAPHPRVSNTRGLEHSRCRHPPHLAPSPRPGRQGLSRRAARRGARRRLGARRAARRHLARHACRAGSSNSRPAATQHPICRSHGFRSCLVAAPRPRPRPSSRGARAASSRAASRCTRCAARRCRLPSPRPTSSDLPRSPLISARRCRRSAGRRGWARRRSRAGWAARSGAATSRARSSR